MELNNLPQFLQDYMYLCAENNFPVQVVLQTPRKGETVSSDMDDMEFELQEYATIHKNNGNGSVQNLDVIYKHKFCLDLDIMSLFPAPENNNEALILEMDQKDEYKVIFKI